MYLELERRTWLVSPYSLFLNIGALRAKKKYTEKTILDEAALSRDLDKVRQLGYAVDNEEMEIGVRCVASPIRQHIGSIIAAVSISGPSSRLTSDRTSQVGELVRHAADEISADLGYTNIGTV